MHAAQLTPPFGDARSIAQHLLAAPVPIVFGFDVDGVLAPIVEHADDATLTPGVLDALTLLVTRPDTTVAAISGRTVAELRRFGFPPEMQLIGSHGAEHDGVPVSLTPSEAALLERCKSLVDAAVGRAGDGAWAEHKPAAVVLHVRQASPEAGETASRWLAEQATSHVPEALLKAGSAVVELMVRPADKGTALTALIAHERAATTVFLGDDVTDEDAFAVLGPGDVGVKVGTADTVATQRLESPSDVLVLLQALTAE